MAVYRALINTEDRLSGWRGDFEYDLGGFISGRDFRGKQIGCAVEWCDPIAYSPNADYTTINANNGKGLILELMTFPQPNCWQSWSGDCRALCLLQNYVESGYNGVQQDNPYIRTKSMAVTYNGDVLNTGIFRFRVSMFDGTNVAPTDSGNNMEAYTFSLVFWEIGDTVGYGPSFPFYRAWLNTADKLSGTVQDCVMQFDLRMNSSWSLGRRRKERWMCAVDFCTAVKHDNATLSSGLKLVCKDFRRQDNYSDAFHQFLRSYKTEEEKFYGYRYSIKPLCTDHIGFTMDESPESVERLRLQIVDAVTNAAPDTPTNLEDYIVSIVFWRVPEDGAFTDCD